MSASRMSCPDTVHGPLQAPCIIVETSDQVFPKVISRITPEMNPAVPQVMARPGAYQKLAATAPA